MLAYGWSDLEGSTVDEAMATWMVGLTVGQGCQYSKALLALAVGFGPLSTSSPKTVTDPDAPELAWEAL